MTQDNKSMDEIEQSVRDATDEMDCDGVRVGDPISLSELAEIIRAGQESDESTLD